MEPGLPLCRDAVMVLPGIMGSELIDIRTGEVLWGLSPKAYVRLWTSGEGIRRLHLTDEERSGIHRRVRATRTLRFPSASPGLGGFEPYTALVKRIRGQAPHRDAVAEFPYDWRLSVSVNASLLADAADDHLLRWRRHPQGNRDAALVLVAHSMGGLVAGYFTEQLGGCGLVRQTITLGTPFHGAVKAAHLLNSGRGAPVPLPRARLRALAATLPGVHDLLPSYRCVDDGAGGRRLTPQDVADIGGDPELAASSLRLHEIFAEPDRTRLSTVVGVEQPTMQSLRIENGVVVPQWHLPATAGELDPVNHAGDGTVYVEAALGGVEPIASLPQSHAGIARTPEARAVVSAKLIRGRLGPPMGGEGPGVEVPDLVAVGQPCEIGINGAADAMPTCTVTELDSGEQVDVRPSRRSGELRAVTVLPRQGIYRVEVKEGAFSAVTAIVLACAVEDLTLSDAG